MAEATPVVCMDCGASFLRWSRKGRGPLRCKECRARRHRAELADYYRRTSQRKPTHWTCADCRGEFIRPVKSGPTPTRCEPCGAARRRSRANAGQRAKTAANQAIATRPVDECVDCGVKYERQNKRGVRKRCEPCRLVRYRAHYKKYQPNRDRSPRPCETCGITVLPPDLGPVPRWCRPCARVVQQQQRTEWLKARPELQRAQWREHKQRRRARKRTGEIERFSNREIFERDGWICGICREPVDQQLKYPDRMSPSLDHVIPLSRGGGHTRANVQLAHLGCNVDKNDRILDEAG